MWAHQGWPKLLQSLWLRDKSSDDIVLFAYAPNKADFGDGLRISVETEYPFRESVVVRVESDAPKSFGLKLRVPSWCGKFSIEVSGEAQQVLASQGFARLEREWKSGDEIALRFEMPVRLESRPRGAVAVWRGPLMFGLKIEEQWKQLKGEEPHADWEVHPASPWNYALLGSDFDVHEKPFGERPFSPEGAAVEIEASARQVESWGLKNNSADVPPQSPVKTDSPAERVTLLPYGAAHLRVGEFPTCA
jgi:hypothetical protein